MQALIDTEEWRPTAVGKYEVSSFGRVRSKDVREFVNSSRAGGHYRLRKGRIIKPNLNKSTGYLQYHLHGEHGTTTILAHRLVANVFIPNFHGLPEVNHLDEDKSNNRVDNLEWCTSSENQLHSSYKQRGSLSATSKLTELEVLEIWSRLLSGEGQTSIAKDYNVTNHTVHKIKVGKNWKWLTDLIKGGT